MSEEQDLNADTSPSEPASDSPDRSQPTGKVDVPPDNEIQAASFEDAVEISSDAPDYIVGIGASAGGLEAVEDFFRQIDPQCGLAFVVIQHLSPDFKSLMDEILARHTSLTIHRAENGMPVERNAIYLITPRKNIVIRNGHLELIEPTPRPGLNLPIDLFFNSLAENSGEKAIGIILSGTGSDGSRGIRSIKEAGGTIMVQDEDTAKFDGMPRAAIATGLADAILPPRDLARDLLRYVKHSVFDSPAGWRRITEETTKLNQLVQILQTMTKLDFSSFKLGTLGRRIERRMGLCNISDLDEYLLLLQNSEHEAMTLARNLLIGVTRFFRDPEVWEGLKRSVLPQIIADTPADETLRVWVTACSTGEEAYSMAILLEECLAELRTKRDIKVFATDIDGDAIEMASTGVYPESIAADVSPRRLNTYFYRHQGRYEIDRSIREKVIFAKHDLLKDPPFTRLHIVTCRNFLIYLQPLAQQRVMSLLHFALRPTGCLMLGASESPGELSYAFESVHDKMRLYRRGRDLNLRTVSHSTGVDMISRLRTATGTPDRYAQKTPDAPLQLAYDRLVEAYGPPALLVSERFDLIHSFGDVSDYITAPRGAFTADVTKTASAEIRVALSTALHRAARDNESISYREIRLREEDETRVINLRVDPIFRRENQQRLFLVLFEELRREENPAGIEFDLNEQKDSRIHDLEIELQQTKENLQATVEELETSNEELQSANEELLASNEELQSTNEELHSVNEELYTVNAEYQSKIEELTAVTNDFDNLLAATDIGVIFLGQDLRIRRFTPAVRDIIDLLDHDLGRSIQQFSSSLRGVDLVACLNEVLQDRKSIQQKVQTESGSWFLMRILPFINERHDVDGAVITLVPIDQLVAAEQSVRDSEEFLQVTLDSLTEEIVIVDEAGMISYVNNAWNQRLSTLSNVGAQGEVGKNYVDFIRGAYEVGDDMLDAIRAVVNGERDDFVGEMTCHIEAGKRWILVRVRRFAADGPRRLCVSHQDFTELKQIEAALSLKTEEQLSSDKVARETAEQLSAIIEHAADGMITINDRGVIETVNPATVNLFGYTKEDLVGQNVKILMRDTDANQHDGHLSRYRETGEKHIIGNGRELVGRRKDGSLFPFHLAVTEFYRGGQKMFVGVLHDISEEVARINRLKQTADRLEIANHEVEQFATIAAHDLQEPIRTIHGYCQLLRDQLEAQLDDSGRSHFDRLGDALRRLQDMIDGLRRYVQLTRETSAIETCDLNAVLGDVLGSLQQVINETGAKLDYPELPTVAGNRQMLQHVFQNLIDNAIKYRDEDPPQISVSAKQVDKAWVLGVHDNGVGIDPMYHDRVFEVFRRANPPQGRSGSGVGLAIAKRIVDRYGGRMWVESEAGAGSSFYVELPDAPQSVL